MKVAVIIPVFNHAGTVGGVVEKVCAAVSGLAEVGEIVLVDDGCTDGSERILRGLGGVTVLRHERNLGKGRALLTGFGYAAERGFTHAVTVDADGQHEAGDVGKLVAAARQWPEDLVIGERDMEGAGSVVPARSRKGRDAARFWLRVETGQDIPDSQCGLRVYPLKQVLGVKYRFGRFDFETEVLARMAWAGVKVRSVGVRCIYFPAEKRVSHFRPWVDTLRGVRVNVFLVARRLAPWPFKRLAGREAAGVRFGRWWKWATWREAVRESLRAGASNAELATAFALGIFVGLLLPVFFLQTILAIYFSRRLHLNVLTAVIGSQISIPPLWPVWVALSYAVGNWVLRGEWVAAKWAFSWQMMPTLLLGNILVALVVAGAGLVMARGVLHCVRAEGAMG